jgi:hypothetical protein
MITILDVTNANGSNTMTMYLSSTTTYSAAFKLEHGRFFALRYKAAATTGLPSLTIQLEQGIGLPSEGAADTTWAIPVNQSDIETALNTTGTRIRAFSPVALPYGRLKFSNTAGTPTDTSLTCKLCIFEDYS